MAIINALKNIGDAVRERTNTTELMTMEQMAEKVKNIPYPQTDTITITANGTYLPPTGIDGYREIVANVEPDYSDIPACEEVEW